MKRHTTRKKLSAHRRGEHRGYNMVFARGGCPLCVADVEDVQRHTAETIENAAKELDLPPDELERTIDRAKQIAHAEGFL